MKSFMNFSLLALAISSFGIGTTEFVIMGLLPDVASDLNVSIPMAGLLITGYALAVAIGAPIMALATARFPRKISLLALMSVFIIGNIMCATATDYNFLMLARVITALCHGAFFGIASVEAASLAPEHRKASAVAMVFTGLTLANVLGVPLGTMLGQEYGWRMTFWAVAAIGIAAFASLWYFLPKQKDKSETTILQELRGLKNAKVWLALAITVMLSASVFTLFTYIAPILGDVTGLTPRAVSLTLLLVGVGLTIGNIAGGRLADWKLAHTLIGCFALITVLQVVFHWTSLSFIPAELTLFLWGMVFFAGCATTHFNTMTIGKAAPNLIATMSVAAFNTGNALGAWAGGRVIDMGFSLQAVPLAAGIFAFIGLLLTLVFFGIKPKMPDTTNPALSPT